MSVLNRLRDLINNPAPRKEPKPYVPEPLRVVKPKVTPSDERMDRHFPIGRNAQRPIEPKYAPAAPSSKCPDRENGEHEWSISRGVKSCWLCGHVEDSSRRDSSTSWQATVYGKNSKR